MIRSCVFAAIFFVTSMAFAEDVKPNFIVSADVIALSQSGFGIKADYVVADDITVGLFHKQYRSDSEGFKVRFNDKNSYSFSEQGLVATYFEDTVDANCFYLSLAYAMAKYKLTYKDSTFGDASDEDSASGLQAKAGYQIYKNFGDGFNVAVQLGLGYGVGGESTYVYDTLFGPNVEVDLKAGTLIDFNVGLTF